MSNTQLDLTLPISGMTCASCASHVEKALNQVPGVKEASVNLATELATVHLSDDVPVQTLVSAVQDTGYGIPTETLTLPIGGMTCAYCAAHVESGLSETPGVLQAGVNLATERATVTYIPSLVTLTDLKKAVAETGYQVLELEETFEEEQGDQEERKMAEARFRMWVAWCFTVPITLWMFAEMFFGIVWPNATIYNLGMIALSLPVLFWVGRKTYRGAWAAVTHGHANYFCKVTNSPAFSR